MIEFLASYWFILVAALAVGAVAGAAIFYFVKLPSKEQLNKVEEWLLYAVTEAEKQLGSGTGQIKLRYVYDLFMTKFPAVAKFISFDTFSSLVDNALTKFKAQLEQNSALQDYVSSN